MPGKGQFARQYNIGDEIGTSGATYVEEAGRYISPNRKNNARLIKCVCANNGCTNTFIAQENRLFKGLRRGLCDECKLCSKNRHIIGKPINDDKYAPIFLGYIKRRKHNVHGIGKYLCTKCNTNEFVRDLSDCESSKRYYCPQCLASQRSSSIGEDTIKQILVDNKITFQTEKIFNDCLSPNGNFLRFDFYLPDYNLCIEFDGEQHFKTNEYFGGEEKLKIQQNNDQIKNRWCQNKNIALIRIPYTILEQNKLTNEYLMSYIARYMKGES